MPYPLPLTRTEAYLAYKAGVVQLSDLKPSLAKPRIGIDDWLAYWTGLKNDYPKNPDGTPKMLQEEEKYIAYLSGVTNTYPEKCLRRVGAYLRYLISARWGRPDHPLNREELYLSLIKTQFIPSGDPSSDITIEGTCKAPFVDVKMYGDTFQQTYTGKNLFNAEAIPYVAKRAYSSDGSVVNWTNYTGTDEYQPVEPNTEYTIWNNKARDTTYLCEYDENKNFIRRTIEATTFTTTATTKYLRWSIYVGAGEIPPTQTQLELGSTASAYEPFVGGQPSPSPDYPQQIQTVTGEQTVTVVGKNLFDVTATPWQGGRAYDENGDLVYWTGYSAIIAYQPVESNSTYTFSNSADKPIYYGLVFYDANKNKISNVTSATRTFTTPADCHYVRFSIQNDSIPTWTQLEAGSTATAYISYSKQTLPINLGTIELCKLGTYQDYIWKDGGDWKVHKAVGKAELWKGTNWRMLDTSIADEHRFSVKVSNTDTPTSASNDTLVHLNSNYWSACTRLQTYWQTQGIAATGASDFSVESFIAFVDSLKTSGVDEWKAWLTANKPVVYYQSTTPTDTTITDSNLIAQLDSLVNGGAEDGTTYIKVNATDPNLPGLLYVEAPKYE